MMAVLGTALEAAVRFSGLTTRTNRNDSFCANMAIIDQPYRDSSAVVALFGSFAAGRLASFTSLDFDGDYSVIASACIRSSKGYALRVMSTSTFRNQLP